MTNNYTAISIGPIYKTMSQGRKSRELWGASYLFSYITREIIEKIKAKCGELPILPQYPDEAGLREIDGKGAGFFPDRLIYEGDIKLDVEKISETIIDTIAVKSGLSKDYLNNYIRISAVAFSLPMNIRIDNDGKDVEDNIVIVANRLVDSIELKEKYFPVIDMVYWRICIGVSDGAFYKLNKNLFYEKAFGDPKKNFPSTIEIATEDFHKINVPEYTRLSKELHPDYCEHHRPTKEELEKDAQKQLDFIDELKKSNCFKLNNNRLLKFKPYHKYIAVVEADGDNVGRLIGAIGNDVSKIEQFSTALFNFSLAATEAIRSYGGTPVYSGGDDLFFFAPIAVCESDGKNLKSIFSLINDIDKTFKKNIVDEPKLRQKDWDIPRNCPSMSYGISITYYKFPLNESRDFAHELLRTAKSKKNEKNKICFKFRKHSGQSLTAEIDKSENESYDKFLDLVKEIPLDDSLLSSVIYKLKDMQVLLTRIAENDERIKIFFEQEFDLGKDRLNEKEKKFIKKIVDYYCQLTHDFSDDNVSMPIRETEKDHSNIGKLYSTLRFMKHLTDERND